MKNEKFPLTVTEKGVSAKIRKASQSKAGKNYDAYVVEFTLFGKRKRVWRSDLDEAKTVAQDACKKIGNGEQSALELKDTDRLAYTRAIEFLPAGIPIDTACREYADALQILDGKASVVEACREWVKRNDVALPKAAVDVAVEELKAQLAADRKSQERQRQVAGVLDRFAGDMNLQVHKITSDIISRWLSGLPLSERSRRNFRDVLGYFCRYCVRRGYLPKGTDWLETVQDYTARKQGAILIYTPDEMKALLSSADKRMIPFLAIGAFAGLRHAEIARLDWSEVDLEDGFIEVRSIENTKSDQRRRLVPIKANLKAWLWMFRNTQTLLSF